MFTIGEGTSSAHLMVVLDVSVSPPKFIGARILSEENPTKTSKVQFLQVMEARASSFGEAHEKLMSFIQSPQGLIFYKWVLPYLRGDSHPEVMAQTVTMDASID